MKKYLVSLPRNKKIAVQAVFDAFTLALSYFLSLVLANGDFASAYQEIDGIVLLISLPLCIRLFFALGTYRTLIRYSSTHSLALLTIAYFSSAIIIWFTSRVFGNSFDWANTIIFLLLTSSIGIGFRFFLRAFLRSTNGQSKTNVLIYGAGDLGRQLLTSIQQGHELRAVGLLDDSVELIGRDIGGIRVYPPSDVQRLISEKSVSVILIAMSNVSREVQEKLTDIVKVNSVIIQKIPAVSDILSGRTKITQFQEVEIEDLLGRDAVIPIPTLLSINASAKSVLVTGAGGSIGSEICRQLLKSSPRKLVLFESSEYALYNIERELSKEIKTMDLDTELVAVLGNICDQDKLSKELVANKVATVFHAAAYKHVPLLESNVLAGLSNNILGTKAVVEASIAAEVSSLTMISTDKAVRPTNIMGASKRFAELICQAYAKKQQKTKISMVRFGNVLGSSGSVVPLFRAQIQNGGPVTVTHRDMTRYFMTIPEASQLVIQASGMAEGGEVFVLDMGQPIRILDLAKSMVHLSGFQPYVQGEDEVSSAPTTDQIEIVFSELRPGEKLYEELLVDAVAESTKHPRIMRAKERMVDLSSLQPVLGELKSYIDRDDVKAAISILRKLPLEYSPKP